MIKKLLFSIIALIVVYYLMIYAYGFGALTQQHAPDRVAEYKGRAHDLFSDRFGTCPEADSRECGFKDTTGRQALSCDAFRSNSDSVNGGTPQNWVLLTLGQSNAANHGQGPHTAVNEVVNFNPHDGKCYRAIDPLLGPSGDGGSPWGLLGDKLIGNGHAKRVLIVPIGIGGTKIERWIPGGDLHPRITHTAEQLSQAGIKPSHILWHQGESDSIKDTTASEYTENFGKLLQSLRGYGFDAPFYAATATLCYTMGREEIRAAQQALPGQFPTVFAGPDTDQLDRISQRFDACHFSAKGQADHAELWHQSLIGG